MPPTEDIYRVSELLHGFAAVYPLDIRTLPDPRGVVLFFDDATEAAEFIRRMSIAAPNRRWCGR